MKLFGITINGNFIGQVLISVFLGWLIGLGIGWINITGHSQNAPLICAIAAGGAAILRLARQQRKLNKSNNS